MFKVVRIETGEIVTVYAVDSYQFLIYEPKRWRWVAMGQFRPVEVTDYAV